MLVTIAIEVLMTLAISLICATGITHTSWAEIKEIMESEEE